ncbi:hypothetical protein I6N95_26490 [Vagococcus sp. BWB3-3]|uniref:Uncharacterized protein n=1 Tax=Vagococcus allomyrinae TaxID=2794353 RepID=A0A940SXW9_9ENTE|nr:hypothetical protein [Vagococcus allomyrinae]MBP1044564.1 hypothetical protein [Vagococcus allomyrinae]
MKKKLGAIVMTLGIAIVSFAFFQMESPKSRGPDKVVKIFEVQRHAIRAEEIRQTLNDRTYLSLNRFSEWQLEGIVLTDDKTESEGKSSENRLYSN